MTSASKIEALKNVMKALRHPTTGCPWDLEQTHQTLATYCIEEAHEVAEAIEQGEPAAMMGELGDLLFQIIFHAQLLEEKKLGDFDAIVTLVHDKMVERHPHVFQEQTTRLSSQEVLEQWNLRKLKKESGTSKTPFSDKLAKIPLAVPALQRASRYGELLSSIGFDWSTPQEVWKKVLEETNELAAAQDNQDNQNMEEELGDLLFVLAQWARLRKFDPEQILRKAMTKFRYRVQFMEEEAPRRYQRQLAQCSLDEMELLWSAAKEAGVPQP